MSTDKDVALSRVRSFESSINIAKLEREREIKEYLVLSGWEVKDDIRYRSTGEQIHVVACKKKDRELFNIEDAFQLEQGNEHN